MSTIITATGHAVAASCLYARSSVIGAAPSGVVAAAGVRGVAPAMSAVVRERGKGIHVAANVADERAEARGFAATDDQLFGQQKTQLLTMWALRGLNPWSDPT
ncbi:hypothetical protein [Streptomyces otsuchiensis]|uniref:hypothetical protein n=1 Tax=Streptomyces otsuchiensis TaxID=2681388 RepID=UPI00103015C9|nr:hypothetical protein [Streptomyces otsuchiensis]